MTMNVISQFMDFIIRWSLCLICTGICILCLLSIWKWFFGVVKRWMFDIFPGIRSWVEKRRRK